MELMATLLCLIHTASATSPWLRARLQPFDLEVHTFPDTGRGLLTRRDREAGATVLAVDDADLIHAARVLRSDNELLAAAEHAASNSAAPLSDEAVLTCFLLREQARGSDYSLTLPNAQPSGVGMTPEEREAYLPRCYSRTAEQTLAYAVDQHAACARALAAVNGTVDSLENFLHAFAHVRARSVEISDSDLDGVGSSIIRAASGRQRGLLPAFDLLNHKSGASCTLERSQGNWHLASACEYKAGDQVFLSYGDRDNLKLLLQYGFALQHNEDARIIFDVRDIVEACVAIRPDVFGDVQELLLQQLAPAEAASEHSTSTEPFQRLSLFSFDAVSLVPRDGLQSALAMMQGLVGALSGSEDEAGALPHDALGQMLRARHAEDEDRLHEIGRREADGVADASGLRAAAATLLRAEVRTIQEALRKKYS